MAVCAMGAVCSLSMELYGGVPTAQTITCAVCVIMETSTSCGIDFTE